MADRWRTPGTVRLMPLLQSQASTDADMESDQEEGPNTNQGEEGVTSLRESYFKGCLVILTFPTLVQKVCDLHVPFCAVIQLTSGGSMRFPTLTSFQI